MSFTKLYLMFLQKHPIATKSITSSVIACSGDILQQFIEYSSPKAFKHKNNNIENIKSNDPLADKSTDSTEIQRSITFKIDVWRTSKMGLWGLCFVGPALHKWYNVLDKLVPSKSVPKRILLDQLLFAPSAMAAFYSFMGLIERKSLNDIKNKLYSAYGSTMAANYAVWIPAQAINFAIVPLHLRVLYVNFIAVGWNAFLSYMENKP